MRRALTLLLLCLIPCAAAAHPGHGSTVGHVHVDPVFAVVLALVVVLAAWKGGR